VKFLIVGEVHHPEELAKAAKDAPPGEAPLFPPSQGTYFWVRSLRKLGHNVDAFMRNAPAVFGWQASRSQRFTGGKTLAALISVISSRVPRLQPDYAVRNRRLLAKVKRCEPDVILLTGGNHIIFPETLARIKADYGCKLVYLSGVSPIVFSHDLERRAAPLYDLVIVNDYYHGIQWLELGAKQMEALPISACDPDYHRPYALTESERAEFGCEVGFVGTLAPDNLYSTRVQALEAVRECGLGIWSIHAIPPALRACYRGPALGERVLRALCGSKVQVNPHGNFMRYGGNMRLFEASGCGVFQIADDLPGASKWFTPGETIVTYRDHDHLRELTAYYLRHDAERQQIAQAARTHVYAHHTYDHRMAALVDLLRAEG
jgi:spore maturation protein CgeB